MNPPVMLILVCEDQRNYVDLHGRNVLQDLPFPVVVLANRAAVVQFESLGGHVEVRQVPWSDHEQVHREALAIAGARPVFAVATLNENLMGLAARLRQDLGVSGMGPGQVLRFRDKLVMKQCAAAAGLRVPAHARCSDRAAVEVLLQAHGVLAIKPVDGFGSREVRFVSSAGELQRWYREHRRPAGFEAEEFIHGTLYHVNAVVRDGEVLLTACAQYLPGMANIDFAAGTPFVTVMVEDKALCDRLEAFSTRLIQALAMTDGVTHMECFHTPGDDIVLCEIAARPGGGGIVYMIEAQYGINYSRAAILLEAGHGHQLRWQPECRHLHGLMGFRLARNSRVRAMPLPAQLADPEVSHVGLFAQAGDFVPAARHCTDYIGLLVFASRSHAHFMERCADLQDRFEQGLDVEVLADGGRMSCVN